MKLKDAEWKECPACDSRKRVADEVHGCDVCHKVFVEDESYLSVDIFRHETRSADKMDFCSWACALKGLATIETDYFVSLPYLHYDDMPEGQRASDFFAAIEALSLQGKRGSK